jgi:hypothetical protein
VITIPLFSPGCAPKSSSYWKFIAAFAALILSSGDNDDALSDDFPSGCI